MSLAEAQPAGRDAEAEARALGLEVRRLSGGCGVEIRGVDLKRPLPPEVFDAINRVFVESAVAFFPGQHLTPPEHVTFARAFGELFIHPYLKGVEGAPELVPVIKEPHETVNFGGEWHSDFTYLEVPPKVSILVAHELPPCGGDTLFADMYRAYDALSDGMKTMLAGLRAVHDSVSATYSTAVAVNAVSQGRAVERVEAVHPVVVTHPETGRRALYVNPAFTRRFDGMSVEESAPLLHYLYAHSTRPELCCRYVWSQGAVGCWDNRCAMHFPVNDYHGFRREMHRATVIGSRPV